MKTYHITLALLPALIHATLGWKVFTTTDDGIWAIEANSSSKQNNYSVTGTISGLRTAAMAVDRARGMLYYSLPVNEDTSHIIQHDTITGSVRGLAYDESSSTLYWTNMVNHSIWSWDVNKEISKRKIVLDLAEGQEPAAIAVHSGHLFWTDNNHESPSVNRMVISTKASTPIVCPNRPHFRPNGLAIGEGRVYWTDDMNGDEYKIESTNLDGTECRTEHGGHNQMPMDLAFLRPSADSVEGTLYWSDWTGNAVWSLNLDDKSKGLTQLFQVENRRHRPMGIVALKP